MFFFFVVTLSLELKVIQDFIQESGDFIWFVKQIATIIPVIVVIVQIHLHKKDRWHDDHDPFCSKCKSEMEPNWKYCPECSKKI